MALKLDVSKAYDRLEWTFLEQTLRKLGFSQQWIGLLMRCVSSVSFSVLINGSVNGLIKPQRGLRQCCPLSPYLFITCAEAFSSLLQRAERQRLIHGLSFGHDLKISHLLFADDSLVFSRASMADCHHLKKILECYSTASGQIFNFDKSSLLLSGNVQQEQAEAIGNLFQLNIVSRHDKYLGLPSMIGRKRSSFFNDLRLKVSNKISSWQHKFFSCGGKEVLIKAAVQAIPAYAMSVFKIPMGVCDDIQKMVASFWWGSRKEGRNIHWAKWEKMSQAKCRGGMGFRDFSSFNRALLAKQGWRIQQHPDSLVARILRARYFQSANFLDAKLGSNPSYIWRSILWGRKIISSGSRCRVGNGQKIPVHGANWILQPSTFQPVFKLSLPSDAKVSDLITEANCWDERKVYEHFNKRDAELIAKIPLPRRPREDELIWHYGKNGKFSVSSGYQTALQIKFPAMPSTSVASKNEWNIIWSLALPQKIRIFVWRAANNQLPSAANLWQRKIIQDPTCQICKLEPETVFHALVGCKSTAKIWKLIQFQDDVRAAHSLDLLSLLHAVKQRRNQADLELLVTIFWAKWTARNQLLFKGKREDPRILIAQAEALIAVYNRVLCPAEKCSKAEQIAPPQNWIPPPVGLVKVNTDAAISSEKNLVGLGAVIRDELGHVSAAAVKVSKLKGDVSYAEAEAMEWGLLVARDTEMTAVIVESDAQ